MKTIKKSRARHPLISLFIGILIIIAMPDYSFAKPSLILADSFWVLPVTLLSLLVVGGIFFSLLSFARGKSYKKNQPKKRGKARWFAGLSGKEYGRTKRQIFQLYDL